MRLVLWANKCGDGNIEEMRGRTSYRQSHHCILPWKYHSANTYRIRIRSECRRPKTNPGPPRNPGLAHAIVEVYRIEKVAGMAFTLCFSIRELKFWKEVTQVYKRLKGYNPFNHTRVLNYIRIWSPNILQHFAGKRKILTWSKWAKC